MARRKTIAVKRKTTTRKCASTRKRTCANTKKKTEDYDEIEIPLNLKPKKESKWKKAAKIALGLAAGGGAAALGYYGYKNRGKLKGKAKEAAEKGKEYAAEKYSAIADMAKKYYADGKAKAGELYSAGKQKAIDKIYGTDYKLSGDKNIYTTEHPAIEDEKIFPLYATPRYRGPPPTYWSSAATAPMRAPLAITSGLEMDVIKELTIIKEDMNRTNRIDIARMMDVLGEYQRQAIEADPFCSTLISGIVSDLLSDANGVENNKDSSNVDRYKSYVEHDIDSLTTLFYRILRN